VGVSPNTAKAWLSVLQASGLVYLLEPYFRNVGKRLVKSPKLYLLDTGLACHLTGIRSWGDLDRSPLAGKLWETYALGQVYRALLDASGARPSLWYWRTKDGQEVDFVIERGGGFEVIEAKLAEVVTESDLGGIRSFEESYGRGSVSRATIICRARKPFPVGRHAVATDGVGLFSKPTPKG
jgi:hypothetical protein